MFLLWVVFLMTPFQLYFITVWGLWRMFAYHKFNNIRHNFTQFCVVKSLVMSRHISWFYVATCLLWILFKAVSSTHHGAFVPISDMSKSWLEWRLRSRSLKTQCSDQVSLCCYLELSCLVIQWRCEGEERFIMKSPPNLVVRGLSPLSTFHPDIWWCQSSDSGLVSARHVYHHLPSCVPHSYYH